MDALYYVFAALTGYILGCFTTAYIVGIIITKKDIRKYGSGNAGTSNVIRTFGVRMGVLTFLGDAAKGLVAVLIGRLIAGEIGGYIGGIAAIIGHDLPVFLSFRGGKGIATSFGVALILQPFLALALIAIVILIVLFTKYFSLGSIIACILLPLGQYLIEPASAGKIITFLIIMAIGVFAHRENIKRLIMGKEHKTDFSKVKP